jgi:hypothetical protein
LDSVDLQWLIEATLDSFEAGEIISVGWARQFFQPYDSTSIPFICDLIHGDDSLTQNFYEFIDFDNDQNGELIFHFGDCDAVILIYTKDKQNNWIEFDRKKYRRAAILGWANKPGSFKIHKKEKFIEILETVNWGSHEREQELSFYHMGRDSLVTALQLAYGICNAPMPSGYFYWYDIEHRFLTDKTLKVIAHPMIFSHQLDTIVFEKDYSLLFTFFPQINKFRQITSLDSCKQLVLVRDERFFMSDAYFDAPCAFEEELLELAQQTPEWAGVIDTILHWEASLERN